MSHQPTFTDKEVIVFDSEIFSNCYLFTAKSLRTDKIVQLWADKPGHMQHLGKLLNNPDLLWVSFNGINFDAPIMCAAVQDRSEAELKQMANAIIENGMRAWMAHRDFGVEQIAFDHVDLIEVAPGVMISLKQYEARLKMKSMIDLPFEHTAVLSDADKVLLAEYCINDIEATEQLWLALQEQIDIRYKITAEYGVDVRSKSDAQMAETIICKKLNVPRDYKPPTPRTVKYKAPDFIQPRSGILQHILQRIESHTFKVNSANGAVELPEFLSEPILLGDGVYQMGIGGLHSKHDKCVSYVSSADEVIIDEDVGSFYPHLILNSELAPKGLGDKYLVAYKDIVVSRMQNKALAGKLKKEILALEKQIREIENGVSQTG